MENGHPVPIAIVGLGAILPDAPNVDKFWDNIKSGRYSVSEVTPDRWDPALFYDPDPAAPDKSYSKIGGWVREFRWDPITWHLPIPPRVVDAMDVAQKWAIACTREALDDYGYPRRSLDFERTAVILGNAMAGEHHYLTSLRLYFPEYARELQGTQSFSALPENVRRQITDELHKRVENRFPNVTEDTMPGELANCIAGRIANLFNLHGPNFVVDAACASAMAAITAAAEGLIENQFDVAITGGIDRNMGASTYIKFCKIGALSATGTRPYAEGADGFVMGEGTAVFLLKRLADAERDGDKVYAVLRGIAGSSDGKGKGITAPNPIGQKICTQRAWQNAGLSPSTASMIEGHGTSTRVGDVVEAQSLAEVLGSHNLPPHSVALGSVKSNFGHLKGAAGAAGMLKTVLSLHNKLIPPSIHCELPNPGIDFAHSPLYVNTELQPWTIANGGVRRAGVSAFGFGGTNFHAVFEEYIPGLSRGNGKRSAAVPTDLSPATQSISATSQTEQLTISNNDRKPPLRGALVIGAETEEQLTERLKAVQARAASGGAAPPPELPSECDLRAVDRIAIDYGDAAELATKAGSALRALSAKQPGMWKALRAQGIFRGHGLKPKVAFLYTGQGSQYVNMLRSLLETEPIVAETFADADRVMRPLLPKPLTEYIFIDSADTAAVERAEADLMQTAITQPAVLAVDLALTKLFAAYGIEPDMVIGHSLGEYGALVAAGVLSFENALEAVSARGREMTRVSVEDKGRMAAVFAPIAEIERIVESVSGYVVIANINSNSQAVIGGASDPVAKAIEAFLQAGYNAVPLPVSHAFHTSIVAPASEPLRQMLRRFHLESPRIPVVGNVSGEFYPTGPGVGPRIVDLLSRQVASPVRFLQGLKTLYDAGARVFVEVGPKKALQGFADDVLGTDLNVLSLFSNHPKFTDAVAFNQALCGLYAWGFGHAREAATTDITVTAARDSAQTKAEPPISSPVLNEHQTNITNATDRSLNMEPVVITGAALGLPGTEHIFDDENIARILEGEQLIDVIPARFREAMLDKHITRLVKDDNGGPTFESIDKVDDVIKLAGRGRIFDLEKEFGIPAERVAAFDRTTKLAIAVGINALRDAGIPLVMRYKSTTLGTQLPDRWGLADCLRDDTGVIFASAFPGYNSFADEFTRYHEERALRQQISMLESLRDRASSGNGHSPLSIDIQRNIDRLQAAVAKLPYVMDRRFLLRGLSMGHSQFADVIGARGPNTQINAACASTTQAISIAEDWIRVGRCKRVIIVSADDITSDNLIDWFGGAFLASGAAATDEVVSDAAIPFDRRRHGMIMGMGAAALVVESAESAHSRGIQPICEVLATVTANSAFHATRLSLDHIGQMMESLMSRAEKDHNIRRDEIAPRTLFVSHETYTPARGGSASAEITALRRVFGDSADKILIANTKGFTGHAMAAGIEDVVAVKSLETGCVPPVPNFKEVDPELGALNLSKGGYCAPEYALRLGAGFGSQISMTLLRWTKTQDEVRRDPRNLGYSYRINDSNAWNEWLTQVADSTGAELEVVNHVLRVRDSKISQRSTIAPTEPTLTIKPLALEPVVPPIVTATPEPTPASAPAAPPVETFESIKDSILQLVADKTGYPKDMLDLDLDLEADLGVDTVKQAEVFATVREMYGIPRDPDLKLRDFPTLNHVIQFARDRRPHLVATTIPVPGSSGATPMPESSPKQTMSQPPAPTQITDTENSVEQRILALVVEKTGYPKDMLDLNLDLEADLGVDTVKQAEMFAAVREIYNIPRDGDLKLRDFPTLAHVIAFVHSKRPDLAPGSTTVPLASEPVLEKPTEITPVEIPSLPASSYTTSTADRILEIMAEKTGYPKDMLDVNLDLEADLGVDTVKQAEMFAAVRAAFNIPRKEDLKLRDFPTLAHVIKFAEDAIAQLAAAPSIVATETQPRPSVDPPPASISFEAAAGVPRRVPSPVLRPPLCLCRNTGVTLASGRRVLVMLDQAGVGNALAQELTSRGVDVLQLDNSIGLDDFEQRLNSWLATGPIHGVYWLPALDDEGSHAKMKLADWHKALGVRVKLLYRAMRLLYNQIVGADTFLISATRMGGLHGYEPHGATSPMGGAVTGFTKTYRRERLDALVKAVDFPADVPPVECAKTLIEETLRDPGAIEIGRKDGLRWTISLEEQPTTSASGGVPLDKNTVFVVTGAAGSIVSAITSDLAAASGGTFYLLDVVPEPDESNSDIQRFISDRENLKRDLFDRMRKRGERATPALVEKELAALERASAALSAIQSIRNSGGKATYFRVNLTDPAAVAKVIETVRSQRGRIDVLLHAAGAERSHMLPDKEPGEFEMVFDVKADGWFNLITAVADMPLKTVLLFSSIAGRFGNAGQGDYAAANDLLCKLALNALTQRPSTRVIAIDWTAWGGIGMATRGSIPKMMEIAGIDMLPPEAGLAVIRRELLAAAPSRELVIAKGLGILLNEWDDTSSISSPSKSPSLNEGVMLKRVVSANIHSGITFEVTLDPKSQPFLNDHRIEATPVLPGVMGIEAFAEAASSMAPGLSIVSIEDVHFLAPFKFYRDEQRSVSTQVTCHRDGSDIIADCVLLGSRTLPTQAQPQITSHFTGRVRLTSKKQLPMIGFAPRLRDDSWLSASDIYRMYFHGPAYQVLARACMQGKVMLGEFAGLLPPDHQPANHSLVLEPRLIELCFQTAGLLEMDLLGHLGLPLQLERIDFRDWPRDLSQSLYAIAVPKNDATAFDVSVVDKYGNVCLQMFGYRTVALPGKVDHERLMKLHAVAA